MISSKRILLLIFLFLLAPAITYAQFIYYPIPELGNCWNRRECYFYCQIPKNTPTCWSYGKYVLALKVLGEETTSKREIIKNLDYPIPELGDCSSPEECFSYCKGNECINVLWK